MKAVFKSVDGCLIPAQTSADDICTKYANDEVLVSVTRPRNVQHHKKFFALRDLLWERTVCSDIYASKEALRSAMIMGAGFVDTIPTKDGLKEIPKSIAFESMDQDEFNKLYEAIVKIVITEICPHMTREDLAAELMEFAA